MSEKKTSSFVEELQKQTLHITAQDNLAEINTVDGVHGLWIPYTKESMREYDLMGYKFPKHGDGVLVNESMYDAKDGYITLGNGGDILAVCAQSEYDRVIHEQAAAYSAIALGEGGRAKKEVIRPSK